MPNIRWLLALITTVHRFLYRATGGVIGHRGPGYRFLLLANRGRKSGHEYLTPLLYVGDGDFVVVASNAGDPREPSWWKNLKAHPDTWVQVRRERIHVHARAATAAEAATLWPRVVAVYASFERCRESAPGARLRWCCWSGRSAARYAARLL